MSSSEAWAIENLQQLREAFQIFDQKERGQVDIEDLKLAIKLGVAGEGGHRWLGS